MAANERVRLTLDEATADDVLFALKFAIDAYVAMGEKAMVEHFRGVRDGIVAQLPDSDD